MRKIYSIFVCLFLIIHFSNFLASPSTAQTINYNDFSQWQTIKDKHFVVYYYNKEHEQTSSEVLRKAEEYYDKIAYQIGYSRYSEFWTWEDRVKIFIFPDKEAFVSTTGQHDWSRGYAVQDSKLFESRAIITYWQESNFIEKLLPHEISHLIVKDFIGFDRSLPIWFEEGLAQQLEVADPDQERAMIYLAKSGQSIGFETFHAWDIRRETDEIKVGVFYAQSRSVISFLMTTYGQAAFQRLCANLRDGMDFLDALSRAYPESISSLKVLEEKWRRYMQDK